MLRSKLLLSVLLLSSACGLGDIDADFDADLTSLDVEARELVRSGDYLDFEHVNAAPYRTELDDSSLIDVRVSPEAAGDYRKVSPDASNSAAELPEGAVIARVVMTPEMEPIKITLMIKGPARFYAGHGDWYYAVLDPAGTFVTMDPDLHGRATECALCHADRAGDDFLFGVPPSMR